MCVSQIEEGVWPDRGCGQMGGGCGQTEGVVRWEECVARQRVWSDGRRVCSQWIQKWIWEQRRGRE